MSGSQRYPIPAETCRVEEAFKRSRFITTLGYTASETEARAFITAVRAEFSDASHNCWAYLIGSPGSTGTVGMSDDGEPHGTAGRPMLTVLTHCGIGDVTAVVTRYFGGTKLGKGGLVRAYSSGVQLALKTVNRAEHVIFATLMVVIDYAAVEPLKRLLPDFEAQIEAEDFAVDVTYTLKMPEEQVAPLCRAVNNLTNGQAQIEQI